MVHIFFSDLVSIQYRRNAYYNWRNLFGKLKMVGRSSLARLIAINSSNFNLAASFGGLLGLFAGFSLMSGYELVYFFVIRVIADAWMKKKAVSLPVDTVDDRSDGMYRKRRGF